MFKRKKKKALNLTPLIDVMTTLIIFILIQSSDSAVEVDQKIQLSEQKYGDTVKENETLTVSLEGLKMEDGFELKMRNGHFSMKDLHKKEDKLIVNLFKEIEEKRKEDEKLNLNLSFDKRIPVETVKKVIYTITVAGVDNIFYLGEQK